MCEKKTNKIQRNILCIILTKARINALFLPLLFRCTIKRHAASVSVCVMICVLFIMRPDSVSGRYYYLPH
jgi:hypothetical protein